MSYRKKVLILGAGITGLGTAYWLSKDDRFEVHIIEESDQVGAMARNFTDGEFTFDSSPHRFFSSSSNIRNQLSQLVGENIPELQKDVRVFVEGKFINYPLNAKSMGRLLKRFVSPSSAKTYSDYMSQKFGDAVSAQIFGPLAKKAYGDITSLDAGMAENSIGCSDSHRFLYPKFGYGIIARRLQEEAMKQGAIFHVGHRISSIDTRDSRVYSVATQDSDGKRTVLSCESLLFSLPLSRLPHLMKGLAPDHRKALRFVQFRHAGVVYLEIKSKPVLPAMSVLFPEPKFPFGRVSEMTKFSSHTCPTGYTSLLVDFACESNSELWKLNEEQIIDRFSQILESLGFLKKNQLKSGFVKKYPNLYPVYNVGYREKLDMIHSIESRYENLFLIGPFGSATYLNADESVDIGFLAADHFREFGKTGSQWQQIQKIAL